MDTARRFLCTVVHPRLFPGPITDPGNPLRVKMLVEVGLEDLLVRAPAPRAKAKVMGKEPLAGIGHKALSTSPGTLSDSKSC